MIHWGSNSKWWNRSLKNWFLKDESLGLKFWDEKLKSALKNWKISWAVKRSLKKSKSGDFADLLGG